MAIREDSDPGDTVSDSLDSPLLTTSEHEGALSASLSNPVGVALNCFVTLISYGAFLFWATASGPARAHFGFTSAEGLHDRPAFGLVINMDIAKRRLDGAVAHQLLDGSHGPARGLCHGNSLSQTPPDRLPPRWDHSEIEGQRVVAYRDGMFANRYEDMKAYCECEVVDDGIAWSPGNARNHQGSGVWQNRGAVGAKSCSQEWPWGRASRVSDSEGLSPKRSEFDDVFLQAIADHEDVLLGLFVDLVLGQHHHDVVDGRHVFLVADVEAAMCRYHVLSFVLCGATAASDEEVTEEAFELSEASGVSSVRTESSPNRRVFDMGTDNVLNQGADARDFTKTFVEGGDCTHFSFFFQLVRCE